MDKITIIGSGNVATHLAMAFKNKGIKILQIYSRQYSNAENLAKRVNAEAISELSKIDDTSDFYFITVSDKAIPDVVSKIPTVSGIVLHTAGCVPISVLNKFQQFGSFYPLQTFTKGIELDFSKIPVFIEGNTEKTAQNIIHFSSSLLNCRMETISSEKRAILHLAAVFANNFVNHLYTISQQILEDTGLSFDCIKPLIEETVRKSCIMNPYHAQTGPARRNDVEVMQLHQNKLCGKERISEIYGLISESITDMYNHNNSKDGH